MSGFTIASSTPGPHREHLGITYARSHTRHLNTHWVLLGKPIQKNPPKTHPNLIQFHFPIPQVMKYYEETFKSMKFAHFWTFCVMWTVPSSGTLKKPGFNPTDHCSAFKKRFFNSDMHIMSDNCYSYRCSVSNI